MNTTHSRKALRPFENIHQFCKDCNTCKLVTVWTSFTDECTGKELEYCTEHEEVEN